MVGVANGGMLRVLMMRLVLAVTYKRTAGLRLRGCTIAACSCKRYFVGIILPVAGEALVLVVVFTSVRRHDS